MYRKANQNESTLIFRGKGVIRSCINTISLVRNEVSTLELKWGVSKNRKLFQ